MALFPSTPPSLPSSPSPHTSSYLQRRRQLFSDNSKRPLRLPLSHTLTHSHTETHTLTGQFSFSFFVKAAAIFPFSSCAFLKTENEKWNKTFLKKKKKMMMVKWSENGHRFHWLKVGRFAYFLHRVNLSRVSFHRWELIRIPDASGCGWIR